MSSSIEFTKVCEHCGKQFIARKRTTRFCSKRCGEHAYKAAKRKEHVAYEQKKADWQTTADVRNLDFLSPTQCAKLLGVCRRSIYYYLESQNIPCYQFKGKTRIRRSDIEKLFDESNGYVRRPPKEKEPIVEFYTTNELMEKYSISNSWLFKAAKEHHIPKTTHHGKTLWSKKHCDAVFGKKNKSPEDITEWYTATEVCEIFGMSLSQVYNLVNREGIPKKKEKNVTYYSKKHIDISKGVSEPEEKQWYSMVEAMNNFKMTRDQLYHYAKTAGVSKKKVGKFTYFNKKELDAVLAPPSI